MYLLTKDGKGVRNCIEFISSENQMKKRKSKNTSVKCLKLRIIT